VSRTGVPSLAVALAAGASAGLGLEEHEGRLRDAFVPAVAALDEADRADRGAIERTLPADSAGAMLSAMAGFREQVHAVRERARREIGEIYRRFNRSYGAFDPLDPYLPSTGGLSHADATRVATIADAARTQVGTLRARVNETVVKRLAPAEIAALTAAKRARLDAFEAVLKAALEAAVAPSPAVTPQEIDKTLRGLTRLAEGWY
jgi:hypothetical protein